MNEHRRAPRRMVGAHIEVLDLMTDQVIGRVGNLSQGGMLLLSSAALVDDALYQLRFKLPDGSGHERQLDAGAHLLWIDEASAPGQQWVGMRFIDIAGADAEFLRTWAEGAEGARH